MIGYSCSSEHYLNILCILIVFPFSKLCKCTTGSIAGVFVWYES